MPERQPAKASAVKAYGAAAGCEAPAAVKGYCGGGRGGGSPNEGPTGEAKKSGGPSPQHGCCGGAATAAPPYCSGGGGGDGASCKGMSTTSLPNSQS